MLQEEGQAVGFSPAGIWVYHPWYVNLFSWYLLFTLLFAAVRSVRLLWALRRRRIAKQPELRSEPSAQNYWKHLQTKARSFRNLAHLTILISVLILSLSLSRAFDDLATQKVAGIGPIAMSASDALSTFSGGMVVAIGLFCVGLLFEGLVGRRKRAIADETKHPQPSTPDQIRAM
jgi:hypothetical protein